MTFIRIALISLSLFSSQALASTIIGNPNAGVVLVDGGSTYIHSIVAYRCSSGSQSIAIKTVLAPNGAAPFTFEQDLFCSIDVNVKWTPGGSLKTLSVGGFDELKVVNGASAVQIEVDAVTKTATLN